MLVLEAIERVNRELGTTTAVITHNAAIAGMADRVDAARRRSHRRDRRERARSTPPRARLVTMQPLDRKLLRDLWRLRGQALAIALVVASRRRRARDVARRRSTRCRRRTRRYYER